MNYSSKNITSGSTLFCLFFFCTLLSCKKRQQEKDAVGISKISYSAPVEVLLNTVPPPQRVELKNAPAPNVVLVPKTVGGYHTIQTEGGEEKVLLRPPVVVKAKMPEANFTNYNTVQGLASDVIYAGLMDSKGRLWFSTGNSVSRYEPSGDGSSFSTFKVGQGSPILYILEDKKGIFWFATWGGGIYKYDGITITQFTTKEGLANNMVTCIVEDKKGNLWITTGGGGVSRYDGKMFTTFNASNGLASNHVNWTEEDLSGNIWFAHFEGGVSRYDGSRFTTFTTEQGLAHNNVFSILRDKRGILWFGTQNGVSRYDGTNFTTLKIGNGLLSNNVNGIAEDKTGNLWFATIGGGVCRYDGTRFAIFTTEQGLANNKVWNITEDKNGNLWFGTDGGGLSRYNGKTINFFTASQGLVKTRVLNITEDKNGILWFGTYAEGISRFDGKEFTNYSTAQGLPEVVVSCIKQDKIGNLWFGSNGGVSRYDGTSFTTFTTRQGLVHNSLNCIFEDKNGHLWFGTNNGLSRYDGASFTSFITLQGLANNFITAIVEDLNEDLWFGTEGGGVSRYNARLNDTVGQGKSFINYTIEQGLAGNLIKSIIKDSSGNLWFATSGGISRFDGSGFLSFNASQGLADDVVSSIAEDNDGTIWFGTDKGLCGLKFNTAAPGNKPGQIMGAGLLKESNELLKTYEPVWEIYHTKTGYPVKDFVDRAICITKLGLPFGDGEDVGMIWGGCSDEKIIRFDPKAVINSNEKPVAFFQSVKINETALNWYSLGHIGRDSTLIAQQEAMVYGTLLPAIVRDSLQKKFGDIQFDSITPHHPLPQNLVLPYRNNRITIDFGAIETSRNFMVRYQYMLEGYDKEWSPVTEKSSVSYGNVSEGSYTFKLKARSPEGIWGEPIEYKFRVLPPWSRTWWAYVSYILLFSLLMYAVFRWRTKSLQQDKIKLEEKVNQRTIQLEHKSTELGKSLENLKVTQTQLIQSEKMASLGELTAGIAHEIQNPLNFVNNFSEVSAELLDEMNMEIDKGNTEVAKLIAQDLKQNLEKINHHGKRAGDIVKGMLQHSRSSSGVKEPTDINKLADEYLRLAYHARLNAAGGQGLRAKDPRDAVHKSLPTGQVGFNAIMKTDFDETIGNINIIPQDIGRVLLNLYNNAFYAATLLPPAGGGVKDPDYKHEPTIWVSTKKFEDKILISVRDNGPGIPQKIVDKIFQPFFTTKPTGQGTGLGLSLSYDIVKGHGGELKVETKEGEGTMFIIQLPVV